MNIVIIGAGIACFNLVHAIRAKDKHVSITVVTECSGDQYYKPNISKALTDDKLPEKLVTLDAQKWCKQYDLTLYSGRKVIGIDIQKQLVITHEERDIHFDKLVIAIGASPRELAIEDGAKDSVFHVNSLSAYYAFTHRLSSTSNVSVVGSGLVGSEMASDLAKNRYNVTLIHPGQAPMAELFPHQFSAYIKRQMTRLGVKFIDQERLARIDTKPDASHKVLKLTMASGKTIDSDIVLNCTGLQPNIEIAAEAGIEVNRGIVTDRFLETSVQGIYAIGDCAEVENQVYQYVPPIIKCARALASTLLGQPEPVNVGTFPVMVKIQDSQIVFIRNSASTDADWSIEESEDGIVAKCFDANSKLTDFAVSGSAIKQHRSLAKQLA